MLSASTAALCSMNTMSTMNTIAPSLRLGFFVWGLVARAAGFGAHKKGSLPALAFRGDFKAVYRK